MSTQFSQRDAGEKILDIRFPKYVEHTAKERKTNLNQLALQMGEPKGYLSRQFRRSRNSAPSLPLIITLSMHLRANLLEPFLDLLPADVRPTRREAALQAEVDRLTAELAAMTRERDIYEKVAMGKGK